MKTKVIRTSTIPISLNKLLKGQLKFLSKDLDVIGLSSSGKDLEEVNEREGVRTIALEMQRGISPVKDLISLIQLYKVFVKEKPQIVHSITPKAGLLSMLAAKLAGVPIRIHMFTGLLFPTKKGISQKIFIKMDQLLCWAATNIYPEGNGVKQDLINYNITSKPLKVLANGNVNGIDLDFFAPEQVSENQKLKLKQNLNITADDFVFVFVGRLVGDKGINELVEAFKSFDNTNVKLLLVGPLELKQDPIKETTLKEIENNNNIISVGSQSDVRPYLAISDVLVFPSYREGFPNVVLQAGAMELPSIVTNISGCNEIIEEGKNGIIIPSRDKNAILNAMNFVIQNEQKRVFFKKNSRQMIKSRYEQQVVWNAISKEYNVLIRDLNNKITKPNANN
ncbi:glycosyltransferase family 4 protein [Empedobacter falsenii]